MIIVYPTETCYGLGCSAFDKKGVKKIYSLKGRSPEKPLIVLVDSVEMWKKIAEVDKHAEEFAEKYWPGALTIVTRKKKIIPDILAKEFVGVRISSHEIPNILIAELKSPLVSTSANLSGGLTPYSIKDVPRSILDACDWVIDVGGLPHKPPSTVIKVENGKVAVLRQGDVKI